MKVLPAEKPPARPSLWYCLLGIPLLLAGIGGFGYSLYHGLTHATDSLTQVVMPGRTEFHWKGAEKYTVFLEHDSVVNGKIYSTAESVSGLECRAQSVRTGTPVTVQKATGGGTYSIGGRSGSAILEITAPEDGDYEFACNYGERPGPDVVLAVGAGFHAALMRTVLGGLGSMFGGFAACAAVVITVLVKRGLFHRILARGSF